MDSSRRKAFTLIELLIVIAILAVLISMLLPAVSRAKQLAKRAMDMANQRNLGQAGMGFAESHGGRSPGGGARYPDGSSYAWCDQLNAEYYRANVVLRGIWQWPLPKEKLICTDAQIYGGRWYTCLYQWSGNAAGGPSWGGNPPQGPYGLAVDPGKINSMYKPYSLQEYHLGARLEKFRRPGTNYLIIESEHANPTFNSAPGGSPHPVVNGRTDTSLPPWAADGDGYGFRHTQPKDWRQYQAQVTGVFTYVDGHVAIVNAMMDLNAPEHFEAPNP